MRDFRVGIILGGISVRVTTVHYPINFYSEHWTVVIINPIKLIGFGMPVNLTSNLAKIWADIECYPYKKKNVADRHLFSFIF